MEPLKFEHPSQFPSEGFLILARRVEPVCRIVAIVTGESVL